MNLDGDDLTGQIYSELYVYKEGLVIGRYSAKYFKLDPKFSSLCINCRDENHFFQLLDTTGKKVLKDNYFKITRIKKSLYLLEKDGLYGFYDGNTKKVVEPTYQQLNYCDGLWLAVKNELFGVIDLDEKTIIPFDDRDILYLDNGIFRVYYLGSCFLFNREGKIINNHSYDRVYNPQKAGYAWFVKDDYCGVINRDGNEIIKWICKNNLRKIIDVKHNLIHAEVNGDHYLFDKDGNVIFGKYKIDSLYILNEETVIIDNYLFNINQIKTQYAFYIQGNSDFKPKVFSSIDDRKHYIDNLNTMFIDKLIEWYRERQTLINVFKTKSSEQLDQLESLINSSTNDDIKSIVKQLKEDDNTCIDELNQKTSAKVKQIKTKLESK